MLTPTRREVAVTSAVKVPAGAQLWGGVYDGATVRRSVSRGWDLIVLLLDDGREVTVGSVVEIAWLHPAGRAAR